MNDIDGGNIEDAPVEQLLDMYFNLRDGTATAHVALLEGTTPVAAGGNSDLARCFIASVLVHRGIGYGCECDRCKDIRADAFRWQARTAPEGEVN